MDVISYKKAKRAEQLAEQIIEGSIETGVLQTNINQKLNDLEVQYAPRLTNAESQLADITKGTIKFAEDFEIQTPETDDTARLQRAVDSFSATEKGVVFLAPKKYNITSLSIPIGVSLQGVYSFDPLRTGGTWFYCTDTVNPAVKLNGNQKIEGVGFWYPNQTWDAVNLKPNIEYPPSIQVQYGAKRVLIRDIFFVNTYYGIDADRWHEFLILDNVQGYAMKYGVICDFSSDVDRWKTVHFNYNALYSAIGEDANFYGAWTRKYGTAFTLKRVDWSVLFDCFCWGYRYGFYITGSVNGYPEGVRIISCGADACGTNIYQDAGGGLNVVDFFFTQFNQFESGVENGGYAIHIEAANDINFSKLRGWNIDRHAIFSNAEMLNIEGLFIRNFGVRGVSDSADYRAIINNSGILNINGGTIKGESLARSSGILLQHGTTGAAIISGVTFKDFVSESVVVNTGTNNINITNNIHKNCIATPIALYGGTPSNYVNTGDIKLA